MNYNSVTLLVKVFVFISVLGTTLLSGCRPLEEFELSDEDLISSVSINQYRDNLPIGEITVVDKSDIRKIVDNLTGAVMTSRRSVNDVPYSDNYLRLSLQIEGGARMSRTIFLYEDCIEEPYVGVYQVKHKFNDVYFIYNAYLDDH